MKLLSFNEASKRVGVNPATVRRLLGRGEFVQPLVLSPRRVAFIEDEVDAWLLARPRVKATSQPTARAQGLAT